MYQGGKGRKTILLIDALFLLRPSILIPCWTVFIIGNFQKNGLDFGPPFFFGIGGFTLLMGGVYILNQIFDRESDRINKKLFLLSLGIFPIWLAVFELAICWIIGVYLALRVSSQFFTIYLIAWILGILYTIPPLKLKAKPFLDLVANMAGYGVLTFLLGAVVRKGFNTGLLIWALPYAFAVGGVFVNTTIVDIEGDKRAGEKTTAIMIGPVAARYLSFILVATGVILALINQDNLALIAFIPSLPFFILAIIKSKRRFDILSFRLPPFILSAVAGIVYPPYLLFLAFIILMMRIYYRKRFGLVFPSPVGG